MTLIAVYTSEGCIGRCDARCYEAQAPACDCKGARQSCEPPEAVAGRQSAPTLPLP
jgi:hypothetical protein